MQMYIASAGTSEGIYRCELDTDSGHMQVIDTTDAIKNCLYLAMHPAQPLLYAVGEGQLYAFRINRDGGLSLINRQSTHGDEPCYVAYSHDGLYALVVNYAGADGAGSIAVFPVHEDGSVAPASHHFQASTGGAGVHPSRQDASHPHMIRPTPDDTFVLVPDLGTDKVMIYRLDRERGRLQPHTQPYITVQAGSGPRHLAFHPTQRIFYVLSELSPVLTVVTYDGDFEVAGTYPTLPPDADPTTNLGADIHITPSGRFLYASNRGHNSFVCYAIHPNGTQLTYSGHQSTQGDWTRGFALDPAGQWLIAAHQRSNDLHTFRIDANTGHLSATDHTLTLPAPVCVMLAQAFPEK